MTEQRVTESPRKTEQEERGKHEVAVKVDGHRKEVPPGTYIVSQFKTLVGVDPSRDLDEVIGGHFKPLKDDQQLIIKGGEVFVSHVRHGGSS
jgi:hypothetical protein